MTGNSGWWAVIGPFVVAGLIAQGAFRLLLRPDMLADLALAEREVADLENRRDHEGSARSEADDTSAEEIRDELARTTERVRALAPSLATPLDPERVLQSLNSLASGAGVHLRRFAPEPEQRLDEYRGRAIAVVAEGAFFDLLRLFEGISRLAQLVLIDDLELQAAADGLVQARFVAVSLRATRLGVGFESGADSRLGALPEDAAGAEGEESAW